MGQSVFRVAEAGSIKEELQCLALSIFVCACSVVSRQKWNGSQDRLLTKPIFE